MDNDGCTRARSRVAACALGILASLLVPGVVVGEVIHGRVLDGHAAYDALRANTSAVSDGAYKIPLADVAIEVLVPALRAEPWAATTNADGLFSADLGTTVPSGAQVVVRVVRDGERLYSPSKPAVGTSEESPAELFVYPLTESRDELQVIQSVVHDIQVTRDDRGDPSELLRVRISVQVWNRSDRLYVGQKAGFGRREVHRIPVPAEARILRNEGPVPGLQWRRTEDRRYLVIDEPVAGLPDLFSRFDATGAPSAWFVEYLVPPTQHFTMTYGFGVRPSSVQAGDRFDGFLVYVPHEKIEIESNEFQMFRDSPESRKDPFTGEEAHFDVYRLTSPRLPGQSVILPLKIDSATIGQVSQKALFWHGGTVLVGLVAILLGLVLSLARPRGAAADAMVEGLTTEQVLDRIADLDDRFERKQISEAEYQRYRTALVEIAAEELSGGGAPAPTAPAPAASAMPQKAREILAQVGELDARSSTSAADIQARAHLLEALYQTLAAVDAKKS